MSKGRRKPDAAFSLGRGFALYVILLIFSIVFTQALRSPISSVLFWFTLLLPAGSLLYALTGRGSIEVFLASDETTAEKLTPVSYEFRIINTSVLPLPFIDAYISVPSADGVHCVERKVSLSLLPKGSYTFKNDIIFKYRGSYLVGVGSVYASDLLKIFRIRRKINVYSEIFILPRKLNLDRMTDNAPSDLPTDSNTVVTGIESSETNAIREYRGGDSLKHIHWKLSSKMQDLQVNEYKPNTGKNVYVFCDFAKRESELKPVADNKSAHKKNKKIKVKNKREIKLKIEAKPASATLGTEDLMNEAATASAERAEAAAALSAQRNELEAESAAQRAEAEAKHEIHRSSGDGNGDGNDNNVDGNTGNKESKGNTGNTDTQTGAASYFERANEIEPEYVYDMDYFCADGVSELAIGAVMHELQNNNSVTLMWFDSRVQSGFCSYTMRTYSDLELVYRQFSTAPFAPYEYKVTRLPDLIEDVQNPTFLFATAAINIDTIADFTDATNRMGAETTEILFFNPKERYREPSLRGEYVEICRQRLAENKISLTEMRVR